MRKIPPGAANTREPAGLRTADDDDNDRDDDDDDVNAVDATTTGVTTGYSRYAHAARRLPESALGLPRGLPPIVQVRASCLSTCGKEGYARVNYAWAHSFSRRFLRRPRGVRPRGAPGHSAGRRVRVGRRANADGRYGGILVVVTLPRFLPYSSTADLHGPSLVAR